MVPQLLRQGDFRAIFVLAFCSSGLFLLVRAIRATIRHHRFGNSYFELDSLPISPGERLSGKIHLHFETQGARGIDLRLSCIRRVVTGTGEDRSTSNITLWQADKSVPSGAVGPGPLGRAVPVAFEIPAQAVDTNHNDSRDQIVWLLHAEADVPGVDYSDDFEIPVFRTMPSSQPANDTSSQGSFRASSVGFATTQIIDRQSGELPRPARSKIIVSMHDGGTEFYFPPFRTPGRALALFVAFLLFGGASYALINSDVPLFFTAFFILADLFILCGLSRWLSGVHVFSWAMVKSALEKVFLEALRSTFPFPRLVQ
jgi:hypothetical protein